VVELGRVLAPLVENVSAFLDNLVPRLVPGCDPAAVRSTFAVAAAGYTVPRTSDGRRVSAITPSGVPFEASVTGGGGRAEPALRYVTEAATAVPFFGPRLAAQRRALDELTARLPGGARDAASDLGCFVDTLFPDPPAVPARTRFAITFGLVHRADPPAAPAGLKVYGNLGPDPAALARLGDRWPDLALLAERVDGLPFLAPHFATAEADAAGRLGHKLYFRTTARANAASLSVVARRFDASAADLLDELAERGAAPTWHSPVYLCCEVRPDRGALLSVHFPARALDLGPERMLALVRALAVRHHGSTASIDALTSAAARAGGTWTPTVVGIGLVAGGGLGKLNVYLGAGAA
jgi:hypothetical protein